MKVKILRSCRVSGDHKAAGEEFDVEKSDAIALIRMGKAEVAHQADNADDEVIEAKKAAPKPKKKK